MISRRASFKGSKVVEDTVEEQQPWSKDKKKQKATEVLQELIEEHEGRKQDALMLMMSSRKFVEARLDSENSIGAFPSLFLTCLFPHSPLTLVAL